MLQKATFGMSIFQRQAIFIIDLKASRYRNIYLQLIDASCKPP